MTRVPVRRFCALGLQLGLAISPVAGSTIFLNSGTDTTGTVQWNSVGGMGVANTIITPNGVWAPPTGGAQWVSSGNTGVGGVVIANSGAFRMPGPLPSASFFQTFTVPAGPTTGGITVWSDDTAAVYIDSSLAFPVSVASADSHCVGGAIGCDSDEGGYVSLAGLGAGTHTIRFDVWQLGGDTSGLMYTGSVTSAVMPDDQSGGDPPSDDASAPEPATFGLLGGGLLGVALYRRLRG
jgi:hypothetical protein